MNLRIRLKLNNRLALPAFVLLVALLPLFLSCQHRADNLYSEAERLWLDERYEEAANKFRMLITEYPESEKVSSSLYRLGEIYYLNLSDSARALDYFIQVTEREGKNGLKLKTFLHIADIYERTVGNFDLAILQYQRILNDFSSSVDVDEYRLKIARAYFRKGDYQQAVLEYQTLVEESPNSALSLEASFQMANLHFIMSRPKEALSLFEGILKNFPSSKIHFLLKMNSYGGCQN